jgi:hypothetical protein
MDLRKALLAVALSCAASQASALIVDFRADQFASGTDVSHVTAGVSLQGLRQAPEQNYSVISTSIMSRSCVPNDFYCGSHTGTSTFHNGVSGFWNYLDYRECGPGRPCFDGFNVLEIAFDQPTDYLGLETTWASDPVGFIAYDIHGNEILSCGTSTCGTATFQGDQLMFSTFSVQRAQADIARVIFGGDDGVGRIGAIRYSVPEPGTAALFAAGLLGLAVSRRIRPRGATSKQ